MSEFLVSENFDFGFWDEEEDNEPKNDRELLQQVKAKLAIGATTLDQTTQHEYDLILYEDFKQFDKNVRNYLENTAQFDSKLNVKTVNHAHFLITKNRMNFIRTKNLQKIRKKARKDEIKQKRQIEEMKTKKQSKNKKIVTKIREEEKTAKSKIKSKYTYIPLDKNLITLEKYLLKVSKKYEEFCKSRMKQIEEKQNKKERNKQRWEKIIEFIYVLNRREDISETIYGKKWVEIFKRRKNTELSPEYMESKLLENIEMMVKDNKSLKPISEILKINNYFTQNELLQIEDWILYSSSNDPVILFMFDDILLEKEVKNDIENQLKLFIDTNIEEERKIEETNSEMNFTLEFMTVSYNIRQKLLSLAIKIKENSKDKLKFDPEQFLNNWLQSVKRKVVYNDWYNFYLHQLKIFNDYLKLVFELNITDNNFTLAQLIELKSNQNKPLMTIYKKLPKNKNEKKVRQQHEMEKIQIAKRNLYRKIVQIPPKHAKIVEQVKKELFNNNRHEASVEKVNIILEENIFNTNKKVENTEEAKNDALDSEYLNIIHNLADGVKTGKYKYENLMKMYEKFINSQILKSEDELNTQIINEKNLASMTSQPTNNGILKLLRDKNKIKIMKKQMKVNAQRKHEMSVIEYRKIKFSAISKPRKIKNTIKRTMNHVYKHIARKQQEIVEELKSPTPEFKVCISIPKSNVLTCKKKIVKKRDPFIEKLDVKLENIQNQAFKFDKQILKLEYS